MLSWRPCSPCLTFSLLLVVALVSPVLEAGESHPSPEINQFTPQGTVKHVRQASARFSEPMVPFGDPRRRTDAQC
jgi:alpha-2-macroglobulin